jgi:Na+-translocating ferredoxin:NAD+ oxidoreductase RNF subunit RnfB
MTKIDIKKCTGCGGCINLCPAIAISMINDVVTVNEELCTRDNIYIKVCSMRNLMKLQNEEGLFKRGVILWQKSMI